MLECANYFQLGGGLAGEGIVAGGMVVGSFFGPVGFAVATGIGVAAGIGTAAGWFDTIEYRTISHLSSGRNYQGY